MRTSRVLLFVAAGSLAACGGFLGFGDDDDDDVDTPSPGPGSEAGAETATGATDIDGGPSGDGATDPGDADLGDVTIIAPPFDASVDGPPSGQLFPRLATFESGTLTMPNGADVNDGMDLLNSGALKGTYSAHTKNASTSIGFTFASKPPDEIYLAFLFRFDALPPTQSPAAFFRLALAGGGNIAAAVQNDGDIYVIGGSSPTKITNVQVGIVKRFGLHARVSTAALQAAVIPDGPFSGVVPVDIGWASPATILGSSLGELSNTSLRVTVDQIVFDETGFDK